MNASSDYIGKISVGYATKAGLTLQMFPKKDLLKTKYRLRRVKNDIDALKAVAVDLIFDGKPTHIGYVTSEYSSLLAGYLKSGEKIELRGVTLHQGRMNSHTKQFGLNAFFEKEPLEYIESPDFDAKVAKVTGISIGILVLSLIAVTLGSII